MSATYFGMGASSGIAIGRAFVWPRAIPAVSPHAGSQFGTEDEIARLEAATRAVEEELIELHNRVEREVGSDEAEIFSAHILILTDPALIEAAKRQIGPDCGAEQAIETVVEEQASLLEQLGDEYLSQRAADVRDVGKRVLAHLQGRATALPRLEEPAIVVAEDLTPSETARLPKEKLLGLVTEAGGQTSHVVILARALGIPVVVGVKGILGRVESGWTLAMDGVRGEVAVQPSPEEVDEWRQRRERLAREHLALASFLTQPAVTTDGRRVTVRANISSLADVQRALDAGADGVGLFRTEFLYMDRGELPSEEEQFEVYREVVERFAPHPVVIRTLDIGGDKDLPYLGLTSEPNPFLGWRAVRYSLASPEILRTQLRAILRAAAFGEVRIMFPLIVSTEEIVQLKAELGLARRELGLSGRAEDEHIRVGIMVETPAAALLAEQMACEVDFFSIGSNDLTQYTLAADRHNEKVAHIFDAYHPAVLRLMAMTAAAAHHGGIDVSICGEMAGDPLATPLLLGLGLHILSTAAPSVPIIKRQIRALCLETARNLAKRALELSSGDEVRELLEREDAGS